MFSAMMVSPLFCMRPSPVWLGKLPVPRKFSGEKENMIVIHYDVFFSSCSKKIKLILSCPEDMVMGDQVANWDCHVWRDLVKMEMRDLGKKKNTLSTKTWKIFGFTVKQTSLSVTFILYKTAPPTMRWQSKVWRLPYAWQWLCPRLCNQYFYRTYIHL